MICVYVRTLATDIRSSTFPSKPPPCANKALVSHIKAGARCQWFCLATVGARYQKFNVKFIQFYITESLTSRYYLTFAFAIYEDSNFRSFKHLMWSSSHAFWWMPVCGFPRPQKPNTEMQTPRNPTWTNMVLESEKNNFLDLDIIEDCQFISSWNLANVLHMENCHNLDSFGLSDLSLN